MEGYNLIINHSAAAYAQSNLTGHSCLTTGDQGQLPMVLMKSSLNDNCPSETTSQKLTHTLPARTSLLLLLLWYSTEMSEEKRNLVISLQEENKGWRWIAACSVVNPNKESFSECSVCYVLYSSLLKDHFEGTVPISMLSCSKSLHSAHHTSSVMDRVLKNDRYDGCWRVI